MTDIDSEDQQYDRAHWQQLNRDNAIAGLPPVMPDQWAGINAMAEEMDNLLGVPVAELDNNPKAQAAAAEKLREALRPDNQDDFEEMHLDIPEPGLDTRWRPDYQGGDICPRAYVYSLPARTFMWVPLQDYGQWEQVAAAYKDDKLRCQVHCIRGCEYFANTPPTMPLTAYIVNRGETLVILYICSLCRQRMDDPSWTGDEYPQRGPLPWYDEGPTAPEPDSQDDPFDH